MNAETQLIPAHQELVAVWEEHMKCEFETRSAADTMRTRIEGAYVNHVPVLTGGVGLDDVKTFYDKNYPTDAARYGYGAGLRDGR